MVETTEIFRSVHNPDISYGMPIQLVLNRPLKDIDLFIGYLKRHHPKLVQSFVRHLQKKIRELINDQRNTDIFEFEAENLNDFPELEIDYKKAVLQLLQYEKYSSEVDDGKAMFLFRDVLHSYLIPAAYIAETMVALLPREGLDFYKRYVDFRTAHEKRLPHRENLEDFFNAVKQIYHENPQEQVFCFVKDGPLYAKIKFCLWKEVLKDIDSEIGYAVACHFDFEAAKQYNENFVLTRSKTIMQGDSFCDFCYQDTRLKIIDHPNDDFWANLS